MLREQPAKSDASGDTEPRRFEMVQRMTDAPLTRDPESGLPVKRIINGGMGLQFKGLKRSTVVNKKSAAATACGCATGRPHRHTHGEGKRLFSRRAFFISACYGRKGLH